MERNVHTWLWSPDDDVNCFLGRCFQKTLEMSPVGSSSVAESNWFRTIGLRSLSKKNRDTPQGEFVCINIGESDVFLVLDGFLETTDRLGRFDFDRERS